MAQQQMQRHGQPQAAKKKGILDQMSLPAVLAAVLTSMTSFLFSSKLGLTGSLIGAGIAAAVSTMASQLYNAMINSSVEKIQDLSKQVQELGEEHQGTATLPGVSRTRVRRNQNDPYATPDAAARYSSIAPEGLREEAARRHRTTIMKRTFVVAVVAALIALLAYGIVVRVATQGQGIGPTSFEEISQPVVQETEATTTTDASAQTDATKESDAQATSTTVTGNGAESSSDAASGTQTTDATGSTTGTDGGQATEQGTSGADGTAADTSGTGQGTSLEATPSGTTSGETPAS